MFGRLSDSTTAQNRITSLSLRWVIGCLSCLNNPRNSAGTFWFTQNGVATRFSVEFKVGVCWSFLFGLFWVYQLTAKLTQQKQRQLGEDLTFCVFFWCWENLGPDELVAFKALQKLASALIRKWSAGADTRHRTEVPAPLWVSFDKRGSFPLCPDLCGCS